MSEPKPLFIYHNVHLKGEKKKKIQLLSLSVTQVFSLRSVNVLRCQAAPVQMCLHVTKIKLPGNVLFHMELWLLFAQFTLKVTEKGTGQPMLLLPMLVRAASRHSLTAILLICHGQLEAQLRIQCWITLFPQISVDLLSAFKSAPFTSAGSSYVQWCN